MTQNRPVITTGRFITHKRQSDMDLLDHALRYASIGWHVYPLYPYIDGVCQCGNDDCDRKHPIAIHGHNSATIKTRPITKWWLKTPNAGIGIATGPSGLAVFDIDVENIDAAQEIIATIDLDTTPHSRSGGDGMHIVFRMPDEYSFRSYQSRMFESIEFKGSNGSFTAPPTMHKSGREYEWIVSPFDVNEIPVLPTIFVERLLELQKQHREAKERSEKRVLLYENDDVADYQLARDALQSIPEEPGYDEWVEICMAVHSRWPDNNGIALIESWSPGRTGEVAEKFDSFNGHNYKLGTLFHYAKQFGWQQPQRTKQHAKQQHVDDMFHDEIPDESPRKNDKKSTNESTADDDDTSNKKSKKKKKSKHIHPYTDSHGRIRRWPEKDDADPITLTDFTAQIVEQIDHENGTREYIIRGEGLRGGSYELRIDAKTYAKPNEFVAAIDAAVGWADSVHPGKGRELAHAIKMLSSEKKVELYKQFNRVGWDNKREFFLFPRRPDMPTSTIIELPNQMGAYGLQDGAELATGIDMFDKLITSMNAEQTIVATMNLLSPPIGRILGLQRHATFIRGRTGSLKTSWTQCAMCIWGDFNNEDSLIKAGLGATNNAIVKMATMASDAPLFIDNFKPNTTSGQSFTGLIHTLLEGRDKSRLNSNQQMRDTDSVYCWPILTGEDIPGNDSASLARILIIPFDQWRNQNPNVDWNEELNDIQSDPKHLSAVGYEWVRWIEENKRVLRDEYKKMPDLIKKWSLRVRSTNDGANKLRIASNLATNELIFRIARRHPLIGEIIEQYYDQHQNALDHLAKTMADETASSLEANQFLDAARSLWTQSIIEIPDIHEIGDRKHFDNMVGWFDGTTMYLSLKSCMQQISRHFGPRHLGNIGKNQILNQLDALRVLINNESETRRSPTGKPMRVYAMDRQKFEEIESNVDSSINEQMNEILDEL